MRTTKEMPDTFKACLLAGLLLGLAGPASAEVLEGTTGRYQVEMIADATLPDHTVYRPVAMAVLKERLPLVAFGNGGCVNIGNAYAAFLGEIASRGYLVTAPGPIVEDLASAQPDGPRVQSKPGQMLASIDWAVREEARAGGPYQGKLDLAHIAVMGHSCGGLEAIAAGADPRVSTVVVLNSGIIRGGIPNPDGTTRQPSGVVPATEVDLPKLHTPIVYLMGGKTDQAMRGAEGDFRDIQGVPLFNASIEFGHGGSWREPGGGLMGQVAIAWLDWQLKGDAAAARTFVGADCGLCRDSRWTVKTKDFSTESQ